MTSPSLHLVFELTTNVSQRERISISTELGYTNARIILTISSEARGNLLFGLQPKVSAPIEYLEFCINTS